MAVARTWQNWIEQAQARGVPRQEAWYLAQSLAQITYASLRAHADEIPDHKTAQALSRMIDRRVRGEPVAYLTQEREFYGRSFFVDERVLIPRHETELLVDLALNALLNRMRSVMSKQNLEPMESVAFLDLCTGSGIIALTLMREAKKAADRESWLGSWIGVGADLSKDALEVARINEGRLQKNESASSPVPLIDWRHADCFDLQDTSSWQGLRFDVIATNPPYIAAQDTHLAQGDLRFEPKIALTDGADGLSFYRRIINHAPQHLKPNGFLWMEHGCDQSLAIQKLLFEHLNWHKIETVRDAAGLPRCTGAQWLG